MNIKVHGKYAENQVNELKMALQHGKITRDDYQRELMILQQEGLVTTTEWNVKSYRY
jgi:predicted RNA-binding protein associated with RNAse of E/G family